MLNWYKTLADLIDLRSFSNLWYWIAVGAFWFSAGRRVLGVPFDLVTAAHDAAQDAGQAAPRGDGDDRGQGAPIPAVARLEAMVALHAARIRDRAARSGLLRTGLAAFAVTLTAILGFGYGMELGQALLLLILPFALIRGLEFATARKAETLAGEPLRRLLFWQRFRVQILGLLFIFLTALWGMWQNINQSALGH